MKDTVLTDDDTCTERFMKKMSELNTNFNPLMMGIVLSVVVGRSFAYEFSIYLIGLVCCMCFNVFKVHRACIDFILNRWAIEFLFPLSCLLLLIGLIVTENTTMLYTITQAWLLVLSFCVRIVGMVEDSYCNIQLIMIVLPWFVRFGLDCTVALTPIVYLHYHPTTFFLEYFRNRRRIVRRKSKKID